MSCYNWERTEADGIVIPTGQWKSVRDDTIRAYNAHQAQLYELALRAHAAIADLPANGRRDREARIRAVAPVLAGDRTNTAIWDLVSLVQMSESRPLKPKKKDFPRLPPTRDASLWLDPEVEIRLVNATRSVHWFVSENNHAADAANEHPLAQGLWARLKAVDWTRGSGGVIIGNDEYNRGGEGVGAGGNYVVRWFGPAGLRQVSPRMLRSSGPTSGVGCFGGRFY